MSDDARRHSRTQGKYSEKFYPDDKRHKNEDKKQKISPVAKEPPEKKFHKRNSDGNKSTNSSFTNEDISPLKYEDNSEYSFSQLEEVKKPIEIKDSGERILSTTENGESKILYEPIFFPEDVGWKYFEHLLDTTNWYSKNILIHGIEYPQPRLVAWFGPFPYSYSGATLEPAEMPDAVKEIKEQIEVHLAKKGIKVTFNSVLLNLYRDGKDSVSWHSDDELTMGISPTIASISLGETRKFEMRPKRRNFEEQSPSDETKYFVHLVHGSLIVMTGCMQDDWQHRVPKEYHDKQERINLTFRTVYPLEEVPEHVPVKESKKEYFTKYNSYNTSSNEYKLNEEQFPPLKSGVNPIDTNMCNILDRPYAINRNDLSGEIWDSEISNDEQNIENNVTYKNTGDNKYKNCKMDNNNLSFNETHIKIFKDSYQNDHKNNFEKKSSKMFHNTVINSPVVNDGQENKFGKKNVYRKFHNGETSLSVNISWENNIDKKEYPRKCHSVTDTQENVDAKRSIKKWHNEANLSKNDIQKKGAHKKFHNCEVNTTLFENRENISKKEYTMKLHEAETKPYINIYPENNFDKKHPEAYHHVGINSPVIMAQENNLDNTEPRKTGLNVDAKEFVPTNIPVSEINTYSQFELEHLVHYEIPLFLGCQLQDHAFALRDKVLARLHEFNRFDREELTFLCELTDGSQKDKNQKLISSKMCKIVINTLERNEASYTRRFYDGNSRQCGYGNHSDRGRRFEKSWQK